MKTKLIISGLIAGILTFGVYLSANAFSIQDLFPWYGGQQVFGGFNDGFKSIQLAPSPSNGNCLKTDGTDNLWGSCGSGGSGGGTWSTSTPTNTSYDVNYPNETDDVVVIGSTATSSAEFYFDPNAQLSLISGTSTFSGRIQIGGTANSDGNQKLRITAAGNASASDSVGGLVRLTNTLNSGSAFGIYSNFGASAANDLMVIQSDNAAYDRRAFRIKQDGTGGAGLFDCLATSGTRSCLEVTSTDLVNSTLGVTGSSTDHSILKVLGNDNDNTDGNASNADSAVVGAFGHDANIGLFISGSDSITSLGSTTGDAIQFRNFDNQSPFRLKYDGRMGLWDFTPDAMLEIVATTSNSLGTGTILPAFYVSSSAAGDGDIFKIGAGGATTTSFFATTASTTNLFLSLGACDTLDTDSTGKVICGTDANSGGSGGGNSKWATSTNLLAIHPSDTSIDVWLGATASATAPFWWDVSATTTYIGTGGGNNDSVLVFGPDTSNQWITGYDVTDKTFAIASSTALGTNNAFSISKKLEVTAPFFNATRGTTTSATSSALFSTKASTTALYLATGTCSGSNALNVVAGLVTCGAVTGSGSASTTLLADNNTWTGTNNFALDKLTIGDWTVSTSTDVGVTGTEYTSIQTALTAGWRPIRVKQGTFSETLDIANTKTKVSGDSLLSIVQCNGATQSPCIDFNNKDETFITGLTVSETNALDVGIAASSSGSSLNRLTFNRFNNFATSTQFNDGNSQNTFYNLLLGNTFFNPQTCIETGGQANAHNSAFNRCRPAQTDGSGGYGHFLSDTRGFASWGDDIEGTTTSNNITAIHLDASSRDISYFAPWIEANTVGVNITSGASRFNMFGGTVSSNGTDIIDNGTDSLFLGVNVTGKTLNKVGTPFGVGTTTSYDAASQAAFGVEGSSILHGLLSIDGDDLLLLGTSADIRSDTDIDLYPGNQTTRSLRVSDNTTNVAISATGATSITVNDSLNINGNATATDATTTNLYVSSKASTTSLFLATGVCSGSNALNVSSIGLVTCGAVTGSGSASTTLLSDNNTFTGLNVFGNGTSTNWFSTTASSTNLFSSIATITQGIFRDLLRIPIKADPTISTAGDIAIDSTQASSSIKYYDGTAERTLHPFFDKPTIHASSTLAYDGAYGASGTTTYVMWNPSRAVTLVDLYCKTDVGTVWYEIGTGSATSTVQCTTSGALSTTDVTFTMRANVMEALGGQATNPNRITVTPTFRWDE